MKNIFKIIILTTLLFSETPLSAQNYFDLISISENLVQSGRLEEAKTTYLEAFERDYPKADLALDYLAFTKLCIRLKEFEDAHEYGKKAIGFNCDLYNNFQTDTVLMKLFEIAHGDEIERSFEYIYQGCEMSINKELMEELEIMANSDQWARTWYSKNIEPFYGVGSTKHEEFWSHQSYMDSIRLSTLDSLISVHGWPGKSIVKETGNKNAWLIVMHGNIDIQKKLLPLIKTSCQKGETKWKYYAYIFDRVKVEENKPTRYGTSFSYNKDMEQYILEVEDKYTINTYREKIGLPPIDAYRVYER